jgi:hypothetical protein
VLVVRAVLFFVLWPIKGGEEKNLNFVFLSYHGIFTSLNGRRLLEVFQPSLALRVRESSTRPPTCHGGTDSLEARDHRRTTKRPWNRRKAVLLVPAQTTGSTRHTRTADSRWDFTQPGVPLVAVANGPSVVPSLAPLSRFCHTHTEIGGPENEPYDAGGSLCAEHTTGPRRLGLFVGKQHRDEMPFVPGGLRLFQSAAPLSKLRQACVPRLFSEPGNSPGARARVCVCVESLRCGGGTE